MRTAQHSAPNTVADAARAKQEVGGGGRRRRRHVVAQAQLLGMLVVVIGVLSVASALSLQLRDRLQLVDKVMAPQWSGIASGTAAVAGLALIVVGRGVAQRRRLACHLTIGLLVVATFAHLAKGLDVEEAVVTGGLAGLLWWRRGLFVVRSPTARLYELAKLAGLILLVAIGYGTIGLVSHAGEVVPALTPGRVVAEVAAGLAGLHGPLQVHGRFGYWFPASLTALGAITVTTLLLVALAPISARGVGPYSDREKVRGLIERTDGDTLDPFILRRDKQWIFAPGRGAAIGYRYVRGVGLATGDPVGDPAEFDPAIRAFLQLCEANGWRAALIGARSDRVPTYQLRGFRTIYLGDEAIIDVGRFTLGGRSMRNVRQMVNRSARAGVTAEILREDDLDDELRRRLRAVARAHHAGHREFGFSMTLGSLLTGAFPDCVLIVCRDDEGKPVAFQRYAPCRLGTALSLDVMCRLPDTPVGTNERMIVEVVDWARAHDIGEVSLNFAAFRSLLAPDAALEPAQAVGAFLVQRLEGRFGIQMDSLRRFNAKFGPRWVGRYLAYQSPVDLPSIVVAALSAEGYLPFDPGRRP